MPSDERVQVALRSVAPQRDAYRAFVASAMARVKGMLAAAHGVERARLELGALGASRIDAARFAELSHGVTLDATARARVARAADVLRNCAEASDREYAIGVDAGTAPYSAIADALAGWGRAFGSALAVDLVRLGQYSTPQHDRLTEVWRFDQWSKAHRLAAPPVVAVVAGVDLRIAELYEFLDGAQHIVLVVEGACPPASLVRHITPSTLVVQTSDGAGLDRFGAYAGPAIAALVPETAACFIHDPEAGTAPWQRLKIWHRPPARPRAAIGGFSAAQQQGELDQLEAIAAQPTLSNTSIEALAAGGSGDVTDRLTNWLLAQSGAAGL